MTDHGSQTHPAYHTIDALRAALGPDAPLAIPAPLASYTWTPEETAQAAKHGILIYTRPDQLAPSQLNRRLTEPDPFERSFLI